MAEDIVLSRTDGHVGILQLNRPKALNAVSFAMLGKIVEKLELFDCDDAIHVMVVHGDERAFAAGADIKDMADSEAVDWYCRDPLGLWEHIANIKKPIIAAVNGFALGGGCELAMMCDIVVAAQGAQFGQPEIKIGIIPGAGGTQRLVRSVGKAVAMELILTGRSITADEALRMGLVSRVVPDDRCVQEALALAQTLAEKRSAVALRVAKEAVLGAHNSFLSQGLRDERRLFHLLCATEDHTEGMKAFIEKRDPVFEGK